MDADSRLALKRHFWVLCPCTSQGRASQRDVFSVNNFFGWGINQKVFFGIGWRNLYPEKDFVSDLWKIQEILSFAAISHPQVFVNERPDCAKVML